ncbi:MAG TPA: TRAP transporter small permease [Desulfobacterales bacterium]|nr:TRAP transporter small permease [Desulfobacterales bacterium]
MSRFEKILLFLSDRLNWIAAGAVIVMMLLTSADVVLRFFRRPIPGTYEIVGLLGAVVISFSLAYTSVKKGHIAVEFLVERFPRKIQTFINAINDFFSALLFGLISWQSMLYALDLKGSGEVSLTLQMPIYPYVYGISTGCGLLCMVLLAEFLKSLQGIRTK